MKSLWCRHQWAILSEQTTMSKVELCDSLFARGGKGLAGAIPYEMVKRKHIQVFTCSVCGKFKRFVEEI